jgi:hypothetical protein
MDTLTVNTLKTIDTYLHKLEFDYINISFNYFKA